MAGKQGSGVFDAGRALEGRLGEVPDLRGNIDQKRKQQPVGERAGVGEDENVALDEDPCQREKPPRDEKAACNGGCRALPSLVGADGRGEFAFAQGASDDERCNVARPDDTEQKQDEGLSVFLHAQHRQGEERVAGIDEAKDRGCGVVKNARHRAGEGAVDQQGKAKPAECDGKKLVGPKYAHGEEDGDGGERGDAGRLGPGGAGDAEELPGGEHGDQGDGKGDGPVGSEEDEQDDERNEDRGGEDSFHASCEDTLPRP